MFVAYHTAECEVDADDCRAVSCSWGGDKSGVAVGGVTCYASGLDTGFALLGDRWQRCGQVDTCRTLSTLRYGLRPTQCPAGGLGRWRPVIE